MLIRDEPFWQGQKAEIAQSEDHESGEAFLAFLEAWCTYAEDSVDSDAAPEAYLEALRASLEELEKDMGRLPPRYLAHALVVVLACWAYGGEDLVRVMTPFERHLIGDEMAALADELQQQAASS